MKRPDDYKMAVAMLSNGISKNKVAGTLGLAWWSVSAIERAEIVEIQSRRRHLAEKIFSAASASIDSAAQRAVEGKATALDAKLLTDAWLSLAGEPCQTVEHRVTIPELDQFEALFINIEATVQPVVPE